jgi:hypothetical protein
MAGIIGGLYLYSIFPDLFLHPVSSALLYAIMFFMICLFAGRIKRSVWNMIDKKWLNISESIFVMILLAYSFYNGIFDYWNSAGIILAAFLIIFTSHTIRENIIKFIFFMLSPVFYYGLLYRNSFFTETIFAISFLLLIENIFSNRRIDHFFIISAVVLAFLVFINPFLSILFFAFCSYYFRQDINRGLLFFMTAAVVFYFIESFLSDQVMALSLHHLNFSFGFVLILILLFVSSIYSGWISRNISEVFFSSSIIILAAVIIYCISLHASFMILLLTITPLLSTIFPLLIFAVRDYDTKEYLGKILDD